MTRPGRSSSSKVMTELASLEETLRKHDEKTRLGPVVAAKRLAWNPLRVGRLLVLPATRTTSRHVTAYAGVLDAAYPTRGREVQAWLAHPTGDLSGRLLVTDIAGGRATTRPGGPSRVRVARTSEP